jgi:hypothetical protein
MLATIPHGPADIGAEVDAWVTFDHHPAQPFRMYERNGEPADPPDPELVEFVSAEPMRPYFGAFADLELKALQDIASDWLESDEGWNEAARFAAEEDERGREYAAELRSER